MATQTVDSKYLIENVVRVDVPLPVEVLNEIRTSVPENLKYFFPSLLRLDGIHFKNEMSISVQVGRGFRGLPPREIESREDIANFTHFEVMVPSEEFIEPYKEYWNLFLGDSSYGIYNYVPRKLIELSIAKADEAYGLEPIEGKF